jgi:peptidyl-prolyl cis-trans isomerase D
MFDLFRSRARLVRYGLGALLMLVAISMVVTLIPGWGSIPAERDQPVAEIGDEVLTQREAQLQIQAAMRNQAFPRELAYIYVPQLIDQMITERALAYEAQRLGFRVTEAELAQTIRSLLPQLYQDGKFIGQEFYANYLAQQNLTIPQFEANVRKQMLLTRLQNLAAEGAIVSPEEVEREYRRRFQKIKLDYIAIPVSKLRAEVRPTDQDLRSYFEQNRVSFRIPEQRSFDLLVIDELKVGERIQLPEAELRRAYQADLDKYRTPERVQVRHILLKTAEKPKQDIPKIRARAEELLKQLRGGADFAELARKNSEDAGSAQKGGDLGWIVRGQAVKAFEDAAFSLKPKELSGVIATEYGFHILQVLDKEQARLKPFAEVREEIARGLKRQRVFELMQSLADQAVAELNKTPQQAAEVAARLNLPLIRVEKAGAGDPIAGLPSGSQQIHEALAGLPKGRATPPIQIEANKLAVAVLREVFPARQAELGEVESQVREQFINRKVQELLERRAREIMEQARAAGGDLKKVAQATGFPFRTTQEFGPDGAADGIGPASSVAEGFTKQVGELFGPVAQGDQRFICKVAARSAPDMSKLAQERQAILTELKGRKARERNELFIDSIRTRLVREGKVKIHEDVIRRLASSYAG